MVNCFSSLRACEAIQCLGLAFLDCFVPRNDGWAGRHCELAKQSRKYNNALFFTGLLRSSQ